MEGSLEGTLIVILTAGTSTQCSKSNKPQPTPTGVGESGDRAASKVDLKDLASTQALGPKGQHDHKLGCFPKEMVGKCLPVSRLVNVGDLGECHTCAVFLCESSHPTKGVET